MESPAPPQTPEIPTDPSVGHMVFGKSLKMHALRHVLQTLGLRVLDEKDAPGGSTSVRISFDGCDPDACARKADFIKKLGGEQSTMTQFPIGMVPDIGPLLESKPEPRRYQGTIFDPEVEAFKECWRTSLHTLSHFFECMDVHEQAEWISNHDEPLEAATNLSQLLVFVSGRHEELVLRGFIDLIQSLERKLLAWHALAQSGNSELVVAQLEVRKGLLLWDEKHNSVSEFSALVSGLGGARSETAVWRLGGTPVPEITEWKKQLALSP